MRGIAAVNKKLIATVNAILGEDHPQTLRQLHYRIFSLGMAGYKNDKSSYRGLCRILTNARRLHRQWELLRKDWTPAEGDRAGAHMAGISVNEAIDAQKLASLSPDLFEQVRCGRKTVDEALKMLTARALESGIPSNWIVDELRQGERVNLWVDAQGYIETVRDSYRRDNWQDQPHYVELWGEKATVLGALRPIANQWGLTVRVCREFGSAGMEDQVGRLFEGIDKPITVFHVGDHDASGVLRENAHRDRWSSGGPAEAVRDTEATVPRAAPARVVKPAEVVFRRLCRRGSGYFGSGH